MSESRVNLLKQVLPPSSARLIEHRQDSSDSASRDLLLADADPDHPEWQKILLADSLLDVFGQRLQSVKTLLDDDGIRSLADVARKYNDDQISRLLEQDHAASRDERGLVEGHGDREGDPSLPQAKAIQQNLFLREPSATIGRLVKERKLPLVADSTHDKPHLDEEAVQDGVHAFFESKPEFNIRQTSVLEALRSPQALEGVKEEHRPAVVSQLKVLQRTQALTDSPDAIPELLGSAVTSAFKASQMSQESFVDLFKDRLDSTTSRNIHAHATDVAVRNDHALVSMLQATRGAGLAAIDGKSSQNVGKQTLQNLVGSTLPPQVNLEQLFGSLDYCACDDCNSVTSPAAYFVELLQFLRNNNLDPFNTASGETGYENTPLDRLLRRRPDLANLQLTCANSNTVLPYIDLANEAMESFIMFLDWFVQSTKVPKQVTLQAFNVVPDESPGGTISPSLLAEPENTNFEAYHQLSQAVFPATQLPYSQPSDSAGKLLRYIGTSRLELGEAFRETYFPPSQTSPATGSPVPITPNQQQDLRRQNALFLQRAADAESLGLMQEEYVILTKESFKTKKFLDTLSGNASSDQQYQAMIGLKPTYQYFGLDYTSDADMTSLAEGTSPTGLTHVKKQFLRRSGLTYLQLVDLLKTEFINPNAFKGNMAGSIVLDSGTGPQLQWEGDMFVPAKGGKLAGPGPVQPAAAAAGAFQVPTTQTAEKQPVGHLYRDGRLVAPNDELLGKISIDGQLKLPNGAPWGTKYPSNIYLIQATTMGSPASDYQALIDDKSLVRISSKSNVIAFIPGLDDCDTNKVRMRHLDGSAVTATEFDRIQRFLRLWRKVGLTMSELDEALRVLGSAAEAVDPPLTQPVGSGAQSTMVTDIKPGFLHQLVLLKRLAELTHLSTTELLPIWSTVGVAGSDNLYDRLFMRPNLLRLDDVFKRDSAGGVLTKSPPAKIEEHAPVLSAALQLKGTELDDVVAHANISADLSLDNVSKIYRYTALSKAVSVSVSDLISLIGLSFLPWTSPLAMLSFAELKQSMDVSGFTVTQLQYIIKGIDSPLRPLGPTSAVALELTRNLYNSLVDIDAQYTDVDNPAAMTNDVLSANAKLVLDTETLEKIIGFIEGSTEYIVAAPKPGGNIVNIPASLATKLTYVDGTQPKVKAKGILTTQEISTAKSLSADPLWSKAIDELFNKAQSVFDLIFLHQIVPEPKIPEARAVLLAGDVPAPADPALPNQSTAPAKRSYLFKVLFAFIRQTLARRSITDAFQAYLSLSRDATDFLLHALKGSQQSQAAIQTLETIHKIPADPAVDWRGYLIVPTTDEYIFALSSPATSSLADTVIIDGARMDFNQRKLNGGSMISLSGNPDAIAKLQWKTSRTTLSPVPLSALLPSSSLNAMFPILATLWRATVFIKGFSLDFEELSYLQSHKQDFGEFDFNSVNLTAWRRVYAYNQLKNDIPRRANSLVKLFKWGRLPTAQSSDTVDRVSEATGWNAAKVSSLIEQGHFNLLDPVNFINEISLVQLQKAISVADKINIDVDKLFVWARPFVSFSLSHEVAQDIQKAAMSKFSPKDWEAAIRSTNDELRQNQSNALQAFLIAQPALVKEGVVDADSLYEFFLIDPQMCPCMETSRMKQATSSVQLFIQRCLMGLEDIGDAKIDQSRWQWMQKYRVWEANRKVFLYPENWIEPSLRDDKTALFQELETELLQKDVNEQSVKDALQAYLFKLSGIADLFVTGLFKQDETEPNRVLRLHVVARTKHSPYIYYYRYLDMLSKNWSSWQQVQAEIPTHSAERGGRPYIQGSYVFPFVYQSRVMIAIPDFVKQSAAPALKAGDTFEGLRNASLDGRMASTYYEIKMGWSELKKGQWTPKQLSSTSVYLYPGSTDDVFADISVYRFVPTLNSPSTEITMSIDAYALDQKKNAWRALGRFAYNGFGFIVAGQAPALELKVKTEFHAAAISSSLLEVTSTQALQPGWDTGFLMDAFRDDIPAVSPSSIIKHELARPPGSKAYLQYPFCHKYSALMLSQLSLQPGVEGLFKTFDLFSGKGSEYDQGRLYGQNDVVVGAGNFHELVQPYSVYNWELGFHAPMTVADRLLQSQQFDAALNMCKHVFDPLALPDGSERPQWKWFPFKSVDATNTLDQIFSQLKPNTPEESWNQINQWRANPFQPHLLARLRPVTYMKWVVMKYIEILIAYGDYYFKQDTLETIPLALQCYVMASHLYGQRGQKIPVRGKKPVHTYQSLINKWDPFDNAIVDLELAFPYSNWGQTSSSSSGTVNSSNMFGFATTRYFCIPENPRLNALRDLIDDRLFKVRHCQSILGVERRLPLYEPPIDPTLLAAAAAGGVSIASMLNDFNATLPNYRFPYLLQKALELCNEVKSLGHEFLVVKEKQDAEAFSLLRQKQEILMSGLIMAQKRLALEEATRSLEALQFSRKAPEYRMKYTLKMLGEDMSAIPDQDDDFAELDEGVDKPVNESGLRITSREKEELDLAFQSQVVSTGTAVVELLASVMEAFPEIGLYAAPFGLGGGAKWGPPNIGRAIGAFARAGRIASDILTYQSVTAGRMNSLARSQQDRYSAVNTAGYEIKNIDKQIVVQKVRITMANKDISIQQQVVDDVKQTETFLKTKYTNAELYAFYEKNVSSLYYQTYTLAYEWAKKAEQAFQFERGVSEAKYLQFGYWESGRDGILAGERLFMGLKQLEAAYHETRGYDFEIAKVTSLRQINPMALLQLRDSGTCEFALPEVLFDMDYPGHYLRKIKSVSLTIPCVVGPYTNLSCTLRLLSHKYRTDPLLQNIADYSESIDQADSRFSTINVPINAIAVSSGQNDGGVFEVNFHDERYLPFEGAGAVSTWRLEMPSSFRQFDYDTMNDVLLTVRYTSKEGGGKLKDGANGAVQDYLAAAINSTASPGLFTFLDVKSDYMTEWYASMRPPPASAPSSQQLQRTLELPRLYEKLPIFTRSKSPTLIAAQGIWIFTQHALDGSAPGKIELLDPGTSAQQTLNLVPSGQKAVKGLHAYQNVQDQGGSIPMTGWKMTLKFSGAPPTASEKLIVLVRYVLQH